MGICARESMVEADKRSIKKQEENMKLVTHKWGLKAITVVTTILYLSISMDLTSYATEVGDTVDADTQVEFDGVKYPSDSSTVLEIASATTGETVTGSCVLYTDGTVVVMGDSSGEVGGKLLSADYIRAFTFTHKSDIKTVVYDESVSKAYSNLFNSSAECVIFNSEGRITPREYPNSYRYSDPLPTKEAEKLIYLKPMNVEVSWYNQTIFDLCSDSGVTVIMGEDITDWPIGLFATDVNKFCHMESLTVDVRGDGSTFSHALYKFSHLKHLSLIGDVVRLGVVGDNLISVSAPDITEIPDYFVQDAANLDYAISDFPTSGITRIGSYAFNATGYDKELDFSGVKYIGDRAFADTNLIDIPDLSDAEYIGERAFSYTKIPEISVTPVTKSVGDYAFAYNKTLTSLVYNASTKFESSMVRGCSSLSKLYILSEVSSGMDKSMLPTTALVYCAANSSVETWCKNNSVAYKVLTDDEIDVITKGQGPTLIKDSKLFDFDNPSDVIFHTDYGEKPAGASGISKVMVDNKTLKVTEDYTVSDTGDITLYTSYMETLCNGDHTLSVLFDNNIFKSGASVRVMSSTVPVVDPDEPPVALDTIKYEFYKDYPDYVIIPVSLNGATEITKLKIGSDIVDPTEYSLDEGAIIISYDYLSELDAGKYRVLPTFNDPAITTLNNIQLLVYDAAADRAAPYLLQSRIVFEGQSFVLAFDYGEGDLSASNVLALVLDNKLLLQDGSTVPFTSRNVKDVKLESGVLELPKVKASPSVATRMVIKEVYEKPDVVASPSEATKASPSEALRVMGSTVRLKDIKVPLSEDMAFYVVDNKIHVDGDAISALELGEGDHLLGAIFDNTEKTTDVKKVILSIMGEESPDPTTPPDPEDPNDPEEPTDSVDPEDPEEPDEPDEPNTPHRGGGSGSSGGSSSSDPVVTKPVGEDSKTPPTVPNDGGSYETNPEDPTDVTYLDKDGNKAPNKWVGDGVNWRHTNADSKIEYGWFMDVDHKWYLLERETGAQFGAAKYGWYKEPQDSNWYYLSTVSTEMCIGWKRIDGQEYYFVPTNNAPTYTGDNLNGWVYIEDTDENPVGKLLVSTTTPDGYVVDENGRKVR